MTWRLILVSCALLLATTFVHALAMHFSLRFLQVMHAEVWAARRRWLRVAFIGALVLVMLLAALVESWIWAMTYLWCGALPDASTALYFSLVTYTTLGYGDVTLAPPWRLLSGVQAANGIIMFGWTTAIIVGAVQRAYLSGAPPTPDEARATASPEPGSPRRTSR